MIQEVITLDKSHLSLLFCPESILGREGQSSIENVIAWFSQSSCSCSKHRWPKTGSSFWTADMEELKNEERIYLHHARNTEHGPQSWLCTSFSFFFSSFFPFSFPFFLLPSPLSSLFSPPFFLLPSFLIPYLFFHLLLVMKVQIYWNESRSIVVVPQDENRLQKTRGWDLAFISGST